MAISGNKSITLTEANSSDTISMSEQALIYVLDDTLGAAVWYKHHVNGSVRRITVTETPANINLDATSLFQISPYDGSTDFYVNSNRVGIVLDDPESVGGSRSIIQYDDGRYFKTITLDQSRSTVETNINNLP